MDITQLILDDHYEQRRLFAILEQVASRDRVTAGEVWSRLAAFLELHAAAEERVKPLDPIPPPTCASSSAPRPRKSPPANSIASV